VSGGEDTPPADAPDPAGTTRSGASAGRLYRRFPALALARRNLRRNRLRSFLAVVGIVIGVLAIATLGVFGNVISVSAAQTLGGIGDQVIVSPNQETGVEALNARDVQAIERATGDRGQVVPLLTGGAQVASGGERSFAQLYGTRTPGLLFEAQAGELPDSLRQGAVVGPAVADALSLRVGSTVEIEGNDYRVIAVLAEPEGFSPIMPDTAVVLPPGEFVDEQFSQIVIEADSGDAAGAIADDIRARLNAREQRVSVFALSTVVSEIAQFFGLLSAFLIGIGAISLLVAGVSILNIMLVTTVERRGEIGVMRAVGIHREDVLRLMLVEAALLGVAGAVGGAVLSVLAVGGLWYFTPIQLAVILVPTNGLYVLGAATFGVLVSLASGAYPAYKAASERPVEALRG
jgi:putative ABC transport system permease protein